MARKTHQRHNVTMRYPLSFLLSLACFSACPNNVVDPDPWPPGVPPGYYEPPPSEGELLYTQYCAFCHGDAGEGYISDNANALANVQFMEVATDDFIKDGIRYGRPGTPMPAWGVDYGGPLVDKHIDEIVNHIHTLTTVIPQDVHELEIIGDPEAGATLFADNCVDCHGDDGSGNSAMSINHPFFLNQASDGFIQYTIQHGRPGTPMPAYKDLLTETEINSLVALIRTWDDDTEPEPLAPFDPDLTDQLINEGGDPADFSGDLIEERYVPAAKVKAAIDDGKSFVALDARPHSDYLAGHISGGIALPFYLIDINIDLLPKDQWIVTYCGCPHAISGQAADKLKENGFEKVAVLDEGFYFWQNMDYPVSRGRERYEDESVQSETGE